jgi:hypothetical protein
VSTTYAVNGRPTTVDDFASTLVAVQNTGAVPLLIEPLGRTVDVGATVTVPGWSTRRTRVRTAGQNGTAVVTLTAGSPAAAPGPGGVTFDPGPASTMSLTVAGGTWYSNEGLTTAVTFPVSITAATVLYPAAAGSITITAVVGGTTQIRGMNVNEGSAEAFVWTPSTDAERAAAGVSAGSNTYAGIFGPGAIAVTATSTTAGEDTIFRTAEYKGSIYVGAGWSQGGGTLGGRLYTLNPTTGALTLAVDTGQQSIRSLAVYRGVLYIGSGIGGRVHSWDGTTLTQVFNSGTSGGSQLAMAVYKGKLYVGETASGKVYSFDGTTWATAVTTGDVHIESLTVWNGLLIIGTGNAPAAHHVLAYDGTNAGVIYTGTSSNKQEALSVTPWRGRLYVTEFDPTGVAKLVEFDPATGAWSTYTIPTGNGGIPTAVYSSVVYRDTLYLGSHPYASIYSFDGAAVRYEGAATGMQSLRDLTVFDDRIIISGRASGTPTTGGAAFTIGDSNRRPSRTNELPRAVAVPSPVPGIFLGTFDPRAITSPLSVASANRAYFNKVRPVAAKFITQLSTSIAVSSGNLDLGIFAADGTNGAPGTMLASTGSTASPGTGKRNLSLTAGVWVLPGVDYWFSEAADNTTITFDALNPAIIHGATYQQDSLFPLATVASPTGPTTTGRLYPVWAV